MGVNIQFKNKKNYKGELIADISIEVQKNLKQLIVHKIKQWSH